MMSALRHGERQLAIGVDVGGTWLRVVARDRGRSVARVAVPVRDAPRVETFLRTLWRRRGWSGAVTAGLVVASRGVWTGPERRTAARRLRGLARRVHVLSDAEAALLGALDGGAGVLVLSGTGSIVIGRDARGRWARAGGLGPLLGDEGSGFWLGREWLGARARDGNGLAARRIARQPDAVARIAALAPRVVARARRGDPRARRIVREGQAQLAALTLRVTRQLGLPPPVSVSWAGTLLGNAWFRRGVIRAVARAGLSARWRRPVRSPVDAAARLAESLSGAREPHDPAGR